MKQRMYKSFNSSDVHYTKNKLYVILYFYNIAIGKFYCTHYKYYDVSLRLFLRLCEPSKLYHQNCGYHKIGLRKSEMITYMYKFYEK